MLSIKYAELISKTLLVKLTDIIMTKPEKSNLIDIITDEILNDSTEKVVQNFIQEHSQFNKVFHIQYPYENGVMADQLNYLINIIKLKTQKSQLHNLYFAVYNADSIPDKNTLKSVLFTIKHKKWPFIIQQYSYALSNYHNLNNLMKGFAFYQTNFEIRYGLINSAFNSKYLYTYVVGHGVYIRFDKLIELNGFENKFWCEDIFMSCLIKNRKINITPVFTLENMESPKSLNVLIRQNAVWFKTAFECIKILKEVKFRDNKINLQSFSWTIQRLRMNITWLLLPVFIIFTFVYGFIKSPVVLLVSVFAYILMMVGTYVPTIHIVERLAKCEISHKLKLLIYISIATLLSNLGPLYSLFSNKKEKFKTIR